MTSAAFPALRLSSPDPNRAYRLDLGLPADAQQFPVVAAPGPALLGTHSPITILLDGHPWTTVAGPDYTAWWTLGLGRHTFQAVARDASGTEVRSDMVEISVQ